MFICVTHSSYLRVCKRILLQQDFRCIWQNKSNLGWASKLPVSWGWSCSPIGPWQWTLYPVLGILEDPEAGVALDLISLHILLSLTTPGGKTAFSNQSLPHTGTYIHTYIHYSFKSLLRVLSFLIDSKRLQGSWDCFIFIKM